MYSIILTACIVIYNYLFLQSLTFHEHAMNKFTLKNYWNILYNESTIKLDKNLLTFLHLMILLTYFYNEKYTYEFL